VRVTGNERGQLIFHGAAVLFVGLLCGLVAVAEEAAKSLPQVWRAAHSALLLAGVWLLTTGAIFPHLVLAPREKAGLIWSLLATAYGFTTAVTVQAATGVRAIGPGESPATVVAFAGNVVAVVGGLLAGLLTLAGAWAALKRGE